MLVSLAGWKSPAAAQPGLASAGMGEVNTELEVQSTPRRCAKQLASEHHGDKNLLRTRGEVVGHVAKPFSQNTA